MPAKGEANVTALFCLEPDMLKVKRGDMIVGGEDSIRRAAGLSCSCSACFPKLKSSASCREPGGPAQFDGE